MSIGFLPFFVLAHFSHHLLTALPVPLLPLIRDDFNLDYTQAGLVVSVFSLFYGISQLPSGWLADRIGPRVLITIGICGVALTGFLVGFSQSYFMLIALLALMGIAGGGYHPSASPLISTSVAPETRGRALGFHLVGGSASFFLAPLIAAGIATFWGWRGSFIGLAIPTMIFGIWFYYLLERILKRNKTQKQSEITQPIRNTLNTKVYLHRLIPFLTLTTFTQAVTYSTMTFIPLFMVDHFGAGEEIAAAFISISYSAGLWASPLGGYFSDRFGSISVLIAACLITAPALYLINVIPYSMPFAALLLVIGMAMYIRMPASETYILNNVPERHRSTIYGIYYFAGMEGGGILTPVMGLLIDHFGFYPSFTISGISVIVMTLLCVGFLRNKKESLPT
ncbi:MFS transporter [Chloroflexota bacterium]